MFASLDSGKPPWVSLSLSAGIHLLVIFTAFSIEQRIDTLRRYENMHVAQLRESVTDLSRKKIYWQVPKKLRRLPRVQPPVRIGESLVARGQKDPDGQTLVADVPKAVSRRQFVWRENSSRILEKDVESANLIALSEIPSNGPAIPAGVNAPVRLKAGPRKFEFSERKQAASTARVVEAPALPDAALGLPGGVDDQRGRVKAGARKFEMTVDRQGRGPIAKQVEAPEELAGSLNGLPPSGVAAGTAQGLGRVKAGPRKFEGLPAGGGQGGSSRRQAMVDAPDIDGAAMAVVGLDPGPSVVLPEGSRPAEFAKAPVEGPASSGTGGGGSKVPGLMAKGPELGADPAAATTVVPDRRIRSLPIPPISRTLSAPLRPSSRVVPPLIESVFAGRNVYTLVVPDPKVSGYVGDWVVWFSPAAAGESRLSAPYPSAKLIGESSPSAPEGRQTIVVFGAVIREDGRLANVKVLRSRADDGGQKRALLELQTWQFRPAMLNGQAVEVDAVIEVGFLF